MSDPKTVADVLSRFEETDPHGHVIALLQLSGMGLISKHDLAKALPFNRPHMDDCECKHDAVAQA